MVTVGDVQSCKGLPDYLIKYPCKADYFSWAFLTFVENSVHKTPDILARV